MPSLRCRVLAKVLSGSIKNLGSDEFSGEITFLAEAIAGNFCQQYPNITRRYAP